VQFRWRTTALFEFLAAAAGARLVAAYFGAQAPRLLAFGHGLPQREPKSVNLPHALFNLFGKRMSLLGCAGQFVLVG
jgi:hypothetical protein